MPLPGSIKGLKNDVPIYGQLGYPVHAFPMRLVTVRQNRMRYGCGGQHRSKMSETERSIVAGPILKYRNEYVLWA